MTTKFHSFQKKSGFNKYGHYQFGLMVILLLITEFIREIFSTDYRFDFMIGFMVGWTLGVYYINNVIINK